MEIRCPYCGDVYDVDWRDGLPEDEDSYTVPNWWMSKINACPNCLNLITPLVKITLE